MITGFSAPDFPFSKIPTEEIARKMLDTYPQFSNILRTTGEGSQDYDFFKDRAYIDGFLNLAKYLDVPVIVVLNGYNELMNNDRAEITLKSNMAIVEEVVKSGVRVYAWAMANELYAKREFTLWNGPFTYSTIANRDNTSRAVDKYMSWIEYYELKIGLAKYALCMATDLNASRKVWDTALYERMDKSIHILDAHIYPSRTLTQLGLETLIKKRLGRGYSTGAEIIVGETNIDFGMYGTGTIDPYARSAKHLAQLQAVLTEIGKYAKAACVHKLGGLNNNNYDLINFAA